MSPLGAWGAGGRSPTTCLPSPSRRRRLTPALRTFERLLLLPVAAWAAELLRSRRPPRRLERHSRERRGEAALRTAATCGSIRSTSALRALPSALAGACSRTVHPWSRQASAVAASSGRSTMSSSPPKRARASRRACWGEGPAAEARTRLMTTSTRPAGFMEAPISSRSWSSRRTPTGSAPPTTRMTSACDTRSAVTAPRPGSRVKSSTSSSAGPPATSTTVQAAARRHCAHTSVIEAGGSSRQRPDLPRPPSRKSPSPTGARIRRKLSASRRPWVARRAAPARAEESSGMPRSWTRLGASTSASTRIAPPQAARP